MFWNIKLFLLMNNNSSNGNNNNNNNNNTNAGLYLVGCVHSGVNYVE